MRFIAVALAVLVAASCSGAHKTAANDAYLSAAVKGKLATVDVDSATAVRVSVSHGAVTLAGEARSAAERQAYVRAARSVDGVVSVDDRLDVNPHLQGLREQTSDAALAARVSAAIAAQAGINVFSVGVDARAGVVTLHGTVSRPSIARTVVETARTVSGVRRVVSRIVVRG